MYNAHWIYFYVFRKDTDVGRMLKFDRLNSEHENAAERVNNEAIRARSFSPQFRFKKS